MDEVRKRASRDEWRKRVARWRDSGLTATEFATETGINPRTLTFWSCVLGKEGRPADAARVPRKGRRAVLAARAANALPLVEIRAASSTVPAGFELESPRGWRLKITSDFDGESLRRLLAVLEAR